VGLGIYPNFESLKNVVGVEYTFEPQPKNREIYDFLYRSFKELYPDLKGFYERLNKQRCDQVQL